MHGIDSCLLAGLPFACGRRDSTAKQIRARRIRSTQSTRGRAPHVERKNFVWTNGLDHMARTISVVSTYHGARGLHAWHRLLPVDWPPICLRSARQHSETNQSEAHQINAIDARPRAARRTEKLRVDKRVGPHGTDDISGLHLPRRSGSSCMASTPACWLASHLPAVGATAQRNKSERGASDQRNRRAAARRTSNGKTSCGQTGWTTWHGRYQWSPLTTALGVFIHGIDSCLLTGLPFACGRRDSTAKQIRARRIRSTQSTRGRAPHVERKNFVWTNGLDHMARTISVVSTYHGARGLHTWHRLLPVDWPPVCLRSARQHSETNQSEAHQINAIDARPRAARRTEKLRVDKRVGPHGTDDISGLHLPRRSGSSCMASTPACWLASHLPAVGATAQRNKSERGASDQRNRRAAARRTSNGKTSCGQTGWTTWHGR